MYLTVPSMCKNKRFNGIILVAGSVDNGIYSSCPNSHAISTHDIAAFAKDIPVHIRVSINAPDYGCRY